MKLAWGLATLLFLIALPVTLLSGNARWLANNQSFYEQGYAKYDSYRATGLPKAELDRATGELISYFNSSQDLPDITVTSGGKAFTLFDERDSVHLRDVRDLIKLDYLAQAVSLAYLAAFSLAFWFRRTERPLTGLSRIWLTGGIFSGAVILAIGIAMLFDFDRLFLQFHLVSFSNDFWVLDPATSYLIRMTPAGFFLDLALWAAGLALAESVAVALAGLAALAWQKRMYLT